MFREHFVVERLVLAREALRRESLECCAARGSSHARTELVVLHETIDGMGECRWVAEWMNEAFHPVRDSLGISTNVEDDAWQSGGHCFHHGARQPFEYRRKREQVEC